MPYFFSFQKNIMIWSGSFLIALVFHAGGYIWLTSSTVMPFDKPADISYSIPVSFESTLSENTFSDESEVKAEPVENHEQQQNTSAHESPSLSPSKEDRDQPLLQEPEQSNVSAIDEPKTVKEPEATVDHEDVLPASSPQQVKQKKVAAPLRKKQVPIGTNTTASPRTRRSTSSSGATGKEMNGRSSSVSAAVWTVAVRQHLQKGLSFSKQAVGKRSQGTVVIRFRIDQTGRVLAVSVAQVSGSPIMDQEVIRHVWRRSPVPRPPQGMSRTIVVPLGFRL